jgi:hypothetical protein
MTNKSTSAIVALGIKRRFMGLSVRTFSAMRIEPIRIARRALSKADQALVKAPGKDRSRCDRGG